MLIFCFVSNRVRICIPQCHSKAFENQSSELSEFPDICRVFFCDLVEQLHDVSWAFHAFVAGVSLSSLAFALGALPSARILHSRGWPVGGASCLAHLCEDLPVKISTQIPRNPDIFGHLCNFSNMFETYVFPQQRKLGVFSHSKGSGASRSSQIRTAQG